MAKIKKVIESQDPNTKLKLTDVSEANDRIIAEVANFFGITIGKTDEIITFLGQYTKDLVEKGAMETILYPGFGRITPNIKALQAKIRRIQDVKSNKYLLELAMKGKNIHYYPQVNPVENEIVRDRRELPGEAEQALDSADT